MTDAADTIIEMMEGKRRKRPERTPELEQALFDLVSEHANVSKAAQTLGILPRTVRKWESSDIEFAKALNIARMAGLEAVADEIIELSDKATQRGRTAPEVNGFRVAIDARKWLLSHLVPSKYGDRLALTGAGGADLIPQMSTDAAIPRLMTILSVLLPTTSNSELHSLASEMALKLAAPAKEEEADGSPD